VIKGLRGDMESSKAGLANHDKEIKGLRDDLQRDKSAPLGKTGGANGGAGTLQTHAGREDLAKLQSLVNGLRSDIGRSNDSPQTCDPRAHVADCISIWKDPALKSPDRPKILCAVTHSHNEIAQAQAIIATWGAKCDKLVFMSDVDDPSIGAVNVHAKWEGSYDTIINKAFRSWLYIHAHYINDYDWFLKADTDTFIFMDNLHKLLDDKYTDFSHDFGISMGRRYKYDEYSLAKFGHKDFSGGVGGYFNAGAAHVMNREAAMTLVCAIRQQGNCSIPHRERVTLRTDWTDEVGSR
jgi:hypothetical protein